MSEHVGLALIVLSAACLGWSCVAGVRIYMADQVIKTQEETIQVMEEHIEMQDRVIEMYGASVDLEMQARRLAAARVAGSA